MMRKNLRWAYLSFCAILAVGCTAYFRDFSLPIMYISLFFAAPLYERLLDKKMTHWIVPCSFAVALALGSLYYLADFCVFPHSARAAYRLHDACGIGILWSLGSLLMVWGTGRRKKAAISPALNGGAE